MGQFDNCECLFSSLTCELEEPRWTPENRPVVDGAKPASGEAAPRVSVLPRSIVIEQASRVGVSMPSRGVSRYTLGRDRGLPAPKRDASWASRRVPVAVEPRAPAARPTGEHVRVVEQAVEHRGDGRGVAEKLAPVVHGTVRGEQRRRALVFELATARWVTQHADALFLGPPGTGKSHLVQAIGFAVIQQGHRVFYREAHILVEDLAEAQLAGTRKDYLAHVTTVPLLIIDDLGMRKLPHTAAEDLLEIVMRRYERASTLLTSNRPVDDWGKLLGDTAAVTAMLDRLLHHAHVLTCGPRSWRTRLHSDRNAS